MRDVAEDAKKVFEQALGLTAEQRAELAYLLLQSIPPPGVRSEEDIAPVLERRAKEVADGTVQLVDWEDVRARLLAKLRTT